MLLFVEYIYIYVRFRIKERQSIDYSMLEYQQSI